MSLLAAVVVLTGCGAAGSPEAARPALAPAVTASASPGPAPTTSAAAAATTTASSAAPATGPATTTVSGAAAASAPPATATATAAAGASGLPPFRHIFLVVMENLGYAAAMATPGLAQLAHRYASATNYDAVAHPSLPNYLALASGGTWGVTSDCFSCYQNERNLGSQLSAAGIAWGAYMEGLPSACDLTPYYLPANYAGKHDPFRYFTDIRDSRSLCAHIQPLTALHLASPPAFAWITPNLCHDGHNCPPTQAAAWLDGFVAKVTASAAWRDGGVLFVTWDEGNGGDTRGGGGHILTLVIAPGLPAGERIAQPFNHYALLHTVEAALGVPPLGAAARAPVMSAFWTAK